MSETASNRLTTKRLVEIRDDIDSAEEWAGFSDDGERGLDGNDAWEWYANEGPTLLRAAHVAHRREGHVRDVRGGRGARAR